MTELVEMAHLVSMPLCRKREDGAFEALQELSYEEEREELFRCLRKGKVALRVTWDYASNEKFQLAFNSQILHFTGHGEDEGLILEEDGMAKLMPPEVITQRLQRRDSKPQVVVCSACRSEAVARAFFEGGVQYVVHVRSTCEVGDDAARDFSQTFYQELLRGVHVPEAFERARDRVRDEDHGNVEASKFNLLKHEEEDDTQSRNGGAKLLAFSEEGCEVAELPAPKINVCSPFIGRAVEVQEIYRHLINPDVNTIVVAGDSDTYRGIGKSQAALCALRYASARNQIHEVLQIDCGFFFYGHPDVISAFSDAFGVAREPYEENALVNRIVSKLASSVRGTAGHVAVLLDNCDLWAQRRGAQFIPFLRCLQAKLGRGSNLIITAQRAPDLDRIKIVRIGPLSAQDAGLLFSKLLPRLRLGTDEVLDGTGGLYEDNWRMALANNPVVMATDGNPSLVEKVANICATRHLYHDRDAILERANLAKQEILSATVVQDAIPPAPAFARTPTYSPPARSAVEVDETESRDLMGRFGLNELVEDVLDVVQDLGMEKGWERFTELVTHRYDNYVRLDAETPSGSAGYTSLISIGYRTLTARDLAFLRGSEKIWNGKTPALDRESLSFFCNWFAHFLRILRSNASLWNRRISSRGVANDPYAIVGLISGGEASRALAGCEARTFLIRLSESLPGHFVLCFKKDGTIHQVPVRILEDGRALDRGGTRYHASLADFLRQESSLWTQLYAGAGTALPMGPIFEDV